MTTKDEALKQALDALKLGAAMYSPAGTAHAQIAAAIIACRESLAQKDEQEPKGVVYAYRRKGIDDFCTCDERRYKELSEKPNLFETAVFYTALENDGVIMEIKVKKLVESAIIPKLATSGAACFVLLAVTGGEVKAHGGSHHCLTGLAFEIPPGHVMLVYSRSGHGFRNSVRLVNSVGVIDSDFRGEVAVKLINDGPLSFSFEPGDRVAQAMVIPVPVCEIVEAGELSDTQRGSGGFGSTGA